MRTLFSLLLLSLPLLGFASDDWPQFRGPNQDGTSDARDVPISWSESENIEWKTLLPGKGWSSPVTQKGIIWLTTAIEVVPTEAEREKLLAHLPPNKAKRHNIASSVQLVALQIQLSTGEILQNKILATTKQPDSIHSLNSYASPTPVLDGEQVFCDFGTYGTFALDAVTGEQQWTHTAPLEHSVGPGSSPVVVGDLLILVRDGVDAQYVVALDKRSGEVRWQTSRPPMDAPDGDRKKAYCTPYLLTQGDQHQLIIPTSQWLVSYVPETGEEIWRAHHGDGFSLVPRPVADDRAVYFCTGFGKPQLWAVGHQGSGDVSETHVLWKNPKRISKKPSPLLADGLLYILEDDGGILSCLEAESGEVVWAERLGGNFSASPLLADDHLYFCNQEGQTHILKPGRNFQPVAINQLDGSHMASPVPLEGGLLLRTDTALYRIKS
ncbi:MAG: PQQ-binding-like beta-propeller repeat protein [Verrucomicrobiota bacterium]